MIRNFVRIFRQPPKEFENYDEKEIMDIVFSIKKDDELLQRVIEEIKYDEMSGNGNIFVNVLSLMPFSSKIVEEFLKTGFLNDKEAYKYLVIMFKTTTKIMDVLYEYKLNLRHQKNITSIELDAKIKDVEKELEKYYFIKEKDEELEKKRKELLKYDYLKNKDIKSLQREVSELERITTEYQKLKKEVDNSKKIFKNIIKDES